MAIIQAETTNILVSFIKVNSESTTQTITGNCRCSTTANISDVTPVLIGETLHQTLQLIVLKTSFIHTVCVHKSTAKKCES